MATALKFGKDSQGFNAYAPKPATLRWMVDLDNGVEASFTLPTDADFYTVSFRYQPGTTVWVAFDDIAEFPIANTISTTTSEMLSASVVLAGGVTISFITPSATAQVSIVVWQGGNA